MKFDGIIDGILFNELFDINKQIQITNSIQIRQIYPAAYQGHC